MQIFIASLNMALIVFVGFLVVFFSFFFVLNELRAFCPLIT